jgi:hypothetical protein
MNGVNRKLFSGSRISPTWRKGADFSISVKMSQEQYQEEFLLCLSSLVSAEKENTRDNLG